jgi:beta-mannosidase
MRLYYPIPKNAEDYIYVSQLVQAYGITKAIHAHRRAKPYNMGSLYWQLNDCWPAISWSSIDGLGHWKALHYKAKHAFENLIISCSEKNNTVGVQLVNDGFSDVTDTLTVSLQDLSGNILFKEQLEVTSASNSSELAHSFNQDSVPFIPNSTFLKINFSHGEFIHYFVKPKDLNLQNKEILSTIEKTESGFSISLTSSTLQKDVFLVSRNKGKWSDNFFDLLPNETKTIMFLTKESTTPNIEIKTLNNLN